VLVSNAPRPWAGVRSILDGYGVAREAYDAILTSGDLTRDLVAARPGARVFHLGPERDAGIFEGSIAYRRPLGREEAVTVTCTLDSVGRASFRTRETVSDEAGIAVEAATTLEVPGRALHSGEREGLAR